MKNYSIVYSEKAINDVDDLFYFINNEYQSPITAKKYIKGIINTIEILSKQPESFSISYRKSIQQYGLDIRRVNYKKISILYSVRDELIYIHRIMASSLIQ